LLFRPSVGKKTGSFGFSALALRAGKNKKYLFVRGFYLYAAQRFGYA